MNFGIFARDSQSCNGKGSKDNFYLDKGVSDSHQLIAIPEISTLIGFKQGKIQVAMIVSK